MKTIKNQILQDQYLKEPDGYGGYILVITDELLTKYHTVAEVQKFYKWMYGQTWMLRSDGSAGYYVYDYERWLCGLPILD